MAKIKSIEEKAKAYDEALERAKHSDGIYPSAKELKEYIFPELRESEDEKKIDFLIHLIEHNVPNHSFAFGDGCAYGYKSKEEAINILKSIRYRIISQPKQEWSEEDERNLDWLMTVCERIHYKSDPQVAPESALMLRGWLRSLKDRVQPQPKQEWSEEDEQHIDSLLKRLKGLCRNVFERTRFAISEDEDWLKSLRPQKQDVMSVDEFRRVVGYLVQDIVANEHMAGAEKQPTKFFVDKYYNKLRLQSHWKPSEKQIEAIRIAAEVGTANNSWAMNVLKELYEQIKTL